MVQVQLSEADAEMFKAFQKHHAFIDALLTSGLPWRYGTTVHLDIDPGGNLKAVRYEEKISFAGKTKE